MSKLFFLLLIVALDASAPSAATANNDDLAKCVLITDDTARLECFDAYAAGVGIHYPPTLVAEDGEADIAASPENRNRQQDSSASNTVISQANAPAAEQDAPSTETESVRHKAEEMAAASVSARVKTFARLNRSKKIRITLDNGQIWQEIDGSRFRGSVEPGTTVTITERRFGGYQMKVPGRSAPIRVRRIQ